MRKFSVFLFTLVALTLLLSSQEEKKDPDKKRPWITQFNGLNPETIDANEWKVKKDGGRFDAITGATVSPRAVVKAIRKAVLFVDANRDRILAAK